MADLVKFFVGNQENLDNLQKIKGQLVIALDTSNSTSPKGTLYYDYNSTQRVKLSSETVEKAIGDETGLNIRQNYLANIEGARNNALYTITAKTGSGVTKNTFNIPINLVGSSATSSKIFLLGAIEQSSNGNNSYTNNNFYIESNVLNGAFKGNLTGKASTAGTADVALSADWNNITNKPAGSLVSQIYKDTNGLNYKTLNGSITNLGLFAPLDAGSKTIPIEYIPKSAIERLFKVTSLEYLMVNSDEFPDLSIGDTILDLSDNIMYYIIGSDLTSANSYQKYSAGIASAVEWSNILNKPTTLVSSFLTSESTTAFTITPRAYTGSNLTAITVPFANTNRAGLITTLAQSFAGNKTFMGDITIGSNTDSGNKTFFMRRKNSSNNDSGVFSVVIGGTANYASIGFQYNEADGTSNDYNLLMSNTNLRPWNNNDYDLGTSSNKFKAVYATTFNGNATTATKLQTARTINGTSFNGTANITTTNWGSTRNFYIADASAAHTGSAVSVNGSSNVTLKLPSTITATLNGTASNAYWLYPDSRLTFGASGLQYFNLYGHEGTSPTTNNTPTTEWYHILRMNYSSSLGYYADIAVPLNDTTGIYWRQIRGGTNYGWFKLLDSNNYTNYTVTKTGSGASGTWGINITGNAVSATKLQTARIIRTNLSSTSTASFDGTANITPGITGTLAISNGGTGATSASAARAALGFTLGNLGITATAAELNKLDGATVTVTEINYLDGVTNNIQTQLNSKAASSHNHSASNITSGTLPIDRGGTGATSAATARNNLGAAAENHSHSAATTSADGFMSTADKTKLNGIATNANNYTHPTSSGNKHIPAGGSSGQILRWSSDGVAKWDDAPNETIYTCAETPTGDVWIDGKPIYCKTFRGAQSAGGAGNGYVIGTINDLAEVVRFDGYIKRADSGTIMPLSYAYFNNNQQMTTVNITDGGNVRIIKGTAWTPEIYVVSVLYTKSTDAPTYYYLPFLTTPNEQGCIVTASSEYSGRYPVEYAFNGQTSNHWACTDNDSQRWVQVQMPYILRNIIVTLTNPKDSGGTLQTNAVNIPTVGTFLGSNNGSSWARIGNFSGRTTAEGEATTHALANSSSVYKYLRVQFTAPGSSSGTWGGFSDIRVEGEVVS